MTTSALLSHCKSLIPSLCSSMHKGQAGRILTIGGSQNYTGAPYYSGMGALKTGADLAFVLCTRDAAIPIKSYSPELMVAPVLPSKTNHMGGDSASLEECEKQFSEMIKRVNSVCIGPGLGRDKTTMNACEKLIKRIRLENLPLIVDGDGLFLISQNLDLIRGYKKCVLTPNPPEFKRLYEAVNGEGSMEKVENSDNPQGEKKTKAQLLKELSSKLGNVTIVQKGEHDIIANGLFSETLECRVDNPSPRRSGGQGDVLSGMLSVMMHWALQAAEKDTVPEWWKEVQKGSENGADSPPAGKEINETRNMVLACYASCLLLKRSAQLAFDKMRRGSTTPNIIDEVHNASQELFPVESRLSKM